MDLENAYEQLQTTILNKLKAETVKGGLLEGVSIQFGDKIKAKPKPPVLYVLFDTAKNDHSHTAIREYWSIPLILVCVNMNQKDLQKGSMDAVKTVSRARKILLQDRSLGLDFVMDTQSLSVDFESRDFQTENGFVFSAQATLNISFFIEE